MYRFLIIFLLAMPLMVSAQVYKSVDKDGNVVFSDTPPKGGDSPVEKVELGTTNSTPPPRHVDRPEPVAEKEKVEVSVKIVDPAHDTTIAIGYAGNFVVQAEVSPPLGNGASAQLLIDDEPQGGPQPHTSWALANVYRGSHVLTVAITDASGKSLAVSPPITVHVLRAGI